MGNVCVGPWGCCCTPWSMAPCPLTGQTSSGWSSRSQQETIMSQSSQRVSIISEKKTKFLGKLVEIS